MTLQWTPDLATGIVEIDQQHRDLYRSIAGLHSAMKGGRLHEVRQVLEFLGSYVAVHFDTEELAMVASGYPGLAEHRAAHQGFTDEYARRRAQVEAGPVTPSMAVELSGWLAVWLRDHVRQLDLAMARFLRPGQRNLAAHAVRLGDFLAGQASRCA